MTKLFDPITIRGVEFRNRIAMSPMCMHSGIPNGRIGPGDIGIWEDGQFEGLKALTDTIHAMSAKAGCQLGHGGRQFPIETLPSVALSAIPFTPESRVPQARASTRSSRRSAAPRAAPEKPVSTWSRSTPRTAVCSTSSSRRSPTTAPTNMAAATRTATASSAV